MTKEMKELIHKYWDEDKHNEIVKLIMDVPEQERDIEMLGELVVAYNNLDRFDDAIELSEKIKTESTEIPAWYYRIAYAYEGKKEYEKAADYLEIGMEVAGRQSNARILKVCQDLYNDCLPYLPESRKSREIQNEPLEILWSEEDNRYNVVKGAVNLGYMGGYRNVQMDVDFDDYDYKRLFSNETEKTNGISLGNYLKEGMDHDEIAKGLTDFFNARLQEMSEHVVQFNQAFLAYLLEDMCDCGYAFWEECKSYTVWDKMPSCDPEDMEEAIYTNDICNEIYKLFDRYYEKPMNGEPDNALVSEQFFKEKLPMFNYEKMLKVVHSDHMSLAPSKISVQCSGEGEAVNIVCSACVDIRNDLSFYGWDNH